MELVSFPIVDDDYIVIDEGLTSVYLIIYDEDGFENINEYQSHLFLDGVFVADDVQQRPSLNSITNTDIDDFIREYIENDSYDNYYFPNLTSSEYAHTDINKYLSIPLIASVRLGICDMTFEVKNDSPQYWACKYNNLTHQGQAFYDMFKKIYTGKSIKILTFVNNIF